MKKMCILFIAFMAVCGFSVAQNQKQPPVKKPSAMQKSVQTQTVVLPDGTTTVVPKQQSNEGGNTSTNSRRKPGKMEAVEVKEVNTREPKN